MKTNTILLTVWITAFSLLGNLLSIQAQESRFSSSNPTKSPNVLFIAVDDLRPELNCYGKEYIQSPHLDQLASEGFLFENAYCNVPVCGASRSSLLTGLRPTPSRFLRYNTYAEKDAAGITSLPQHFHTNGYHTVSLGKIFHHRKDMLESWSEEPWHPSLDDTTGRTWCDYLAEENIRIDQQKETRGRPYEKLDIADEAYYDGKIANRAIEQLRVLSKQDMPFFLAVGFLKPHLPFNAPSKYWDLYQESDIQLPEFMDYPKDAPVTAHHNFGELRSYYSVPKQGKVPDSLARKLVHGYYACVSYTDAMIGRVLAAVKQLGLEEETIIILWGDHGWMLGDHGLWCKHSTFNAAMQVPIILKVPGTSGGKRIHALTEFVDIYPSLCELADLPLPDHLQGHSFVPYLENPELEGKKALFARWQIADAIKTDRYLYTEWFSESDSVMGRMLFDHKEDKEESVNIAESPKHQEMISRFHDELIRKRKVK